MNPKRIVIRLKEGALVNNLHIPKGHFNVESLYSYRQDPNYSLHKKPLEGKNESENKKYEGSFYTRLNQTEKATYQTYILETKNQTIARDVLNDLQKKDEVEIAYLDGFIKLLSLPNDPLFESQKLLFQKLQFDKAWDLTKGNGITTSVLDSGIMANHPDLSQNLTKINGEFGINFTKDATMSDERNHGTPVAGIIAAIGDNNLGIAGTAPQSKLLICKVFSKDDELAFISDAQRAIIDLSSRFIKIVNCSWEIPNYDPISNPAHKELVRTINDHSNKLLFIFAAGNSGVDMNNDISFLNDTHSVIKVGALMQTDNRWFQSNFGKDVVYAYGDQIVSTTNDASFQTIGTATSFAAPFVTGLSALLLSSKPSLTPSDIKETIETTTDKIPQISDSEGLGRINARKALDKIRSSVAI